MNVVYALTRNVYDQILPSVRSLVSVHPDVHVFIVCEDDEFPVDLPIKPICVNVSCQGIFDKSSVNYNNRFKYINLLKVCYPTLLPGVDKVIHLDIDTIVCDSLEPLWAIDVEGKWFAACPEHQGNYRPFGNLYYNMGIAVINLKQMRQDKAEGPLVWYLNHVKQPWADQDAWNLFGMAFGKVVPFHTRFNESIMTGESYNPAIVHYCSITDWWTNERMYRHELLKRWKQ